MEFAHKDSWGLIGAMKEDARGRAEVKISPLNLAFIAYLGVRTATSALSGTPSIAGLAAGAAIAMYVGANAFDGFMESRNLDPDKIPNDFVDAIREKMDHDAIVTEIKGGLWLVNERSLDGSYSPSVMTPEEYKKFKKEFNKGENLLVEIEAGWKDKLKVTQYVGGKLHSEHGKAATSEYRVTEGEVKAVTEVYAEHGKVRAFNPNYNPDENPDIENSTLPTPG
ncbi:hypothetical protein [Sulfitobacter sp. R18_1]|uniref:hypothetical protein n=1 Tax=Sulfitobacter sp. R18_1 TaxID=2821104 RepID=UPI001ADD4014|nr:hypothetical protein [Sulfitobacter sp. R18_1]MBO9428233.1 hypothetical protein [Sulfitobacter sp. R18_1]